MNSQTSKIPHSLSKLNVNEKSFTHIQFNNFEKSIFIDIFKHHLKIKFSPGWCGAVGWSIIP